MFLHKSLIVQDSFCPGNSTKYELLLVEQQHSYLLCWINKNGPSSGSTMLINKGSNVLHYLYLQEKLQTQNNADAAAILVWVHAALKGKLNVHLPEGFDKRTGLATRLTLVH